MTLGFHIKEPIGQNRIQRYISPSSPGGGTGSEVDVNDCRLVFTKVLLFVRILNIRMLL